MAKRVMSLLWSLMMNPKAPSEVSRSPAITDALQAYADRKGLVDTEITYEYMRQCVKQIQAGGSVLAAMNLLQRLVTAVHPFVDLTDWMYISPMMQQFQGSSMTIAS